MASSLRGAGGVLAIASSTPARVAATRPPPSSPMPRILSSALEPRGRCSLGTPFLADDGAKRHRLRGGMHPRGHPGGGYLHHWAPGHGGGRVRYPRTSGCLQPVVHPPGGWRRFIRRPAPGRATPRGGYQAPRGVLPRISEGDGPLLSG